MDKQIRKRYQSWLAGALLLAILLRLFFLDKNSLWFDEAFSADQALKSIGDIVNGSDPRHPPLYYAFLHYWTQIFGTTEWSLRLPSALLSIVNLGLLHQLGKRLFGLNVAHTGVLLLAWAPLDIWYALEARMYMFVTFIGLLYAVSLLWTSFWRIIPLFLTLIAGFYLDYSAIPLLLGITSVWLVYWWQKKRQGYLLGTLGIAFIFAIVGYLPWWPKFNALLKGLSNVHIFAALRNLLNLPYISAEQYLLALPLFTIGLIFIFYILSNLLQRPSNLRWVTWIVLAGFILAIPLMVIPRLYTIKRVVVTGWPYIILFLAWLISQAKTKEKVLRWSLTAVSLIASLVMVYAVGKDDWRSVAAYLDQNRGPTSVIWVDPAWNEIALKYYAAEESVHKGDIEALTSVADREIWLVAERLPSQVPPSSASEAWLDEQMELADTVPFLRLTLKRYRPG